MSIHMSIHISIYGTQALVAKSAVPYTQALPTLCAELLKAETEMKQTQLVYIKKMLLRQSRLSLTFWGGEQEDALEWDQVGRPLIQ